MYRTFITGDIHGDIDINRFDPKFFPWDNLDKTDVMIVLGDAGLIWNTTNTAALDYMESCPWTTFCVLGNHENYDAIELLPTVKRFNGDCYQASPSVFFAKWGEIYTINGYDYWTMNGAESIDKHLRTEHKTWWSQEMPSIVQLDHGIVTLDGYMKHHKYIDYIITHTCPRTLQWQLLQHNYNGDSTDSLSAYFNLIMKTYDYAAWFFGHYHFDKFINTSHICLYKTILELTPSMHKLLHFRMNEKFNTSD